MAREVHKKRTSAMPAPAHVIYEPVAEDVHDPALATLYRRWLADLAAGRRVPGEEILKYPEAAPLLRNLMLLEVIKDDPFKLDYRYRVYGAEIANAYGQDGPADQRIPERRRQLLRRALRDGDPRQNRHPQPAHAADERERHQVGAADLPAGRTGGEVAAGGEHSEG